MNIHEVALRDRGALWEFAREPGKNGSSRGLWSARLRTCARCGASQKASGALENVPIGGNGPRFSSGLRLNYKR